MRNRLNRLAFGALLASTALATPALAQIDPTIPVAPTRPAVDENGVDLIKGTYTLAQPEIAIGEPGKGGLSYAHYWVTDGWRDSVTATIVSDGNSYVVSIGDISDKFTWNGSAFVGTEGSGTTLTGTPDDSTYTTRDGTVYIFSRTTPDEGTYQPNLARVKRITYPSGERLDYVWLEGTGCQILANPNCVFQIAPDYRKRARLQAIVSNLGYQLLFDYQMDAQPYSPSQLLGDWSTLIAVTSFNKAVENCPENQHSCTFTQSWPTISLAGANQVTSSHSMTVTDALGAATAYTVSSNQLVGVKYPGSSSNDITIAYSGGKVSSVTNRGVTTSYSYVDAGNVCTTTITDPLAHTRVVTSNLTTERILTDKDENGRTTSYQYDAYGRLTRVTQPEGNYLQLTYDGRGNVTEQRAVAKAGSGMADIVTTASYPATCSNPKTCNKPSWTKDAQNNQTDYTYDSGHGGVLTITSPAPAVGAVRPETRFTYAPLQAYYRNSLGNIAASGIPVYKLTAVSTCQTLASCAGVADEVKATVAYGSPGVANNLLATSRSIGAGNGSLTTTNSFGYDARGNLATIDGPLAGTADTVRFRYDVMNRRIGSVSADPDGAGLLKHRAERTTYRLDGQISKQEQGTVNSQSDADWNAFAALEVVDIAYDANDRVTTRKLSGGGTAYALTQTSYDALGRPECSATRMNTAIYGSLPASACALGAAGTFGPDRIAKTVYDAAGQVTQLQVAVGTADAATEATYTYTNNGRLKTLKDGQNNLTTYEYDGFDRLAKTRFPVTAKGANSSSATDYEQLSYDAAGNVTNRRLRDAANIGFTYDKLNRLTLKNLPGAEPDVTYTYDNLGRLTSASQIGNSLSFSYDALGRNLTQVGPQGTVSAEWDLAGRRTKLTYPGAGLYLNYDYLVTGETTKIRENGAMSGIGVLASYGYDNLGRRTSLTFGNGASQAYGYDPVSRLASLTNNLTGTANDLSQTLSYNPAGQIVSNVRTGDAYAWTAHYNENRNYTSNGLNQYTASGVITPTYDSRGNLTSAGNTTYAYSSENMLVSATGGTSASLAYDPMLRLYQLTAGASITRFAYDGLAMIAEYDGANALLRRHVFGPGMDQPLVWYEGSGTTDRRFLGSDERGSIVSVSDAGGTMLALNSYDEYGIPGLTNAGRFQYTGQAWLPELGVQYSKARLFSPTLGRFLQTDPIGYGDGLNLYAYVGNDPANLVDPSGLQELPPDVIVTGTAKWFLPVIQQIAEWGGSRTYNTGFENSAAPNKGLAKQPSRLSPGAHRYVIQQNTVCSASEAFERLRAPGVSAPGAPYARSGTTPRINLPIGNPISQTVDPSTRTIRNVTLEGHSFYPGTVTIQVLPRAGGGSSITIVGEGTGHNPYVNDAAGYAIFGFAARSVAQFCSGRSVYTSVQGG